MLATAFRVFHPDSRPHFDSADWWMGDTRYRWEGDTLVADVVALTDQLWLDQAGNFHSDEIHIIELSYRGGTVLLPNVIRISLAPFASCVNRP